MSAASAKLVCSVVISAIIAAVALAVSSQPTIAGGSQCWNNPMIDWKKHINNWPDDWAHSGGQDPGSEPDHYPGDWDEDAYVLVYRNSWHFDPHPDKTEESHEICVIGGIG
jgi:hypothetical protein